LKTAHTRVQEEHQHAIAARNDALDKIADYERTTRQLMDQIRYASRTAENRYNELRTVKEELSTLLTKQQRRTKMKQVFGAIALSLLMCFGGFIGGMTYEDRVLKDLQARNKRLEAENTRFVSTVDNFADVCVVAGTMDSKTSAQLKSLVNTQALEAKAQVGTFETLPVHEDAHSMTATGAKQHYLVCKLGSEYKAMSVASGTKYERGEVREGQWVAITSGHPLWTAYRDDMAKAKMESLATSERIARDTYDSRLSAVDRLTTQVARIKELRGKISQIEADLQNTPEGEEADLKRQLLSAVKKNEAALVSVVKEQQQAVADSVQEAETKVKIDLGSGNVE
jgi:hypothetical protein